MNVTQESLLIERLRSRAARGMLFDKLPEILYHLAHHVNPQLEPEDAVTLDISKLKAHGHAELQVIARNQIKSLSLSRELRPHVRVLTDRLMQDAFSQHAPTFDAPAPPTPNLRLILFTGCRGPYGNGTKTDLRFVSYELCAHLNVDPDPNEWGTSLVTRGALPIPISMTDQLNALFQMLALRYDGNVPTRMPIYFSVPEWDQPLQL